MSTRGASREKAGVETKPFSGAMTPFVDMRALGYIMGSHEGV